MSYREQTIKTAQQSQMIVFDLFIDSSEVANPQSLSKIMFSLFSVIFFNILIFDALFYSYSLQQIIGRKDSFWMTIDKPIFFPYFIITIIYHPQNFYYYFLLKCIIHYIHCNKYFLHWIDLIQIKIYFSQGYFAD